VNDDQRLGTQREETQREETQREETQREETQREETLSRRSFLGGAARAGGVGLVAGGLGPLLAACHPIPAAPRSQPTPPEPRHTVMWARYPGNEQIADGLPPERHATVRVFTWPGKVSQRCLAAFAKQHRCDVEATTFATMPQALRTLAKSPGTFDVFLGAPSAVVGPLVTRQLIQPLNRSYLPNIANVWPRFSSPYYDVHLRYTIPFTVYTTGIAWRKDLVGEDLYASSAGWSFPWQAKYRGMVGILDDCRESLCLGLLATGTTDLNTPDPRLIDNSQHALLNLTSLVRTRIGNDTAGALATGRRPIHHAWSGQAVMAAAQLPAGLPADLIGYWFPPDGVGPIGNDTGTIPRGARNPVLGHLLLNHLLDPANAVTNMVTSGFQQPLMGLTPERLVSEGALPKNLASAAVLPTFYDNGLKELQLPDPVDHLWQHAWSAVRHG
jgi:spermidine/putrescine transport system substrate-binding protein